MRRSKYGMPKRRAIITYTVAGLLIGELFAVIEYVARVDTEDAQAFVPLAIPFVFVVAQFVTRYSFGPVPVESADAKRLAGHGVELVVEFSPDRRDAAQGLEVELPDGVVALSGLVRDGANGVAYLEVAATAPGVPGARTCRRSSATGSAGPGSSKTSP